MKVVYDDAAENLGHRLSTIDAGVVVLIQRPLQRLECLDEHGGFAPVRAGLTDAGAPIQAHRIWLTRLSTSRTRSAPDRSLGSRVSRSTANVSDSVAFVIIRSSQGTTSDSKAAAISGEGRTEETESNVFRVIVSKTEPCVLACNRCTASLSMKYTKYGLQLPVPTA